MVKYYVIIFTLIIIICLFIFYKRIKKILKTQSDFLNSKKEEIEKVVDNADQIINELNNLSDYVATKIENANSKLIDTMTLVNDKIEYGEKTKEELNNIFDLYNNKIEELEKKSQEKKIYYNKKNVQDNNSNSKYEKIVDMFTQGKDVRQIAKELNIGQGEVKLILGIKK